MEIRKSEFYLNSSHGDHEGTLDHAPPVNPDLVVILDLLIFVPLSLAQLQLHLNLEKLRFYVVHLFLRIRGRGENVMVNLHFEKADE